MHIILLENEDLKKKISYSPKNASFSLIFHIRDEEIVPSADWHSDLLCLF